MQVIIELIHDKGFAATGVTPQVNILELSYVFVLIT